jgi:hypothetical protein
MRLMADSNFLQQGVQLGQDQKIKLLEITETKQTKILGR